MEKHLLKFAIGLALAFTVGCGPKADDETASQTGVESGFGTLSCVENNGCTGSGYWRFKSTVATTTSKNAIVLKTVQLNHDGSSIKVVVFSGRVDLTDGLTLTLTRSGASLIGTLDINGLTQRTITADRLNSFSAQRFDMIVDVSGVDGSNPKVLIYPTNAGDNPLFNSSRAGDLNAPLNATVLPGVLLGITLSDGSLETVRLKDSSQ